MSGPTPTIHIDGQWTTLDVQARSGAVSIQRYGPDFFQKIQPHFQLTNWQAYGQQEHSKGALFREQIYRASHFAQGRLDRHRQVREDIVRSTYDKLREILVTLQDIVQG